LVPELSFYLVFSSPIVLSILPVSWLSGVFVRHCDIGDRPTLLPLPRFRDMKISPRLQPCV